MAKIEHYYTIFEEGGFYHIYNRTIDKKLMFKDEGNYKFFLKQFDNYLSPVIDTYAYCMLRNHFHVLLRVKENLLPVADLMAVESHSNSPDINQNKTVHDIVSHQFRKFFQSYAMAFNKQHGRVGTLFQTPFKRVHVTDNGYLTK